MNSLIQTLYMTPEFRNALYRWDFKEFLQKSLLHEKEKDKDKPKGGDSMEIDGVASLTPEQLIAQRKTQKEVIEYSVAVLFSEINY
jgi:hypothetical protein